MSTAARSFAAGGGFALLVHGGAGSTSGEALDAQQEGCRAAAYAARALLASGASALDAVQRAVELLEDDPRFNAATGGALTRDATLELDASIMDGTSLRAGAVCALPPFRHPIAIARAALDDGAHALYAGPGAARFAHEHGFSPADPEAMITAQARAELQAYLAGHAAATAVGTVGAVARDRRGRLAAATSTGGTVGKRAGRVGDSPIVGAGTYADDEAGAVSATGHGEGILRCTLGFRVTEALRSGAPPARACGDALDFMRARVGSLGGVISVARDGTLGLAHSTPSMSYASAWEASPEVVR